jgi:epoxyqueuosine reductase
LTKKITSPNKLKAFITREATALGFDLCRITKPDTIPEAPLRLKHHLENSYHGSMDWMAETADRRANPKILWPEVRSIIILAMNYTPLHDPMDIINIPEMGAISVYAQNRDYHEIIKGKLKTLAGKISSRTGNDVKVFVDTAPVMEKPLAEAAGIGWQGKHTNLVSRQLGSWFFLGSIFTTADIAPDDKEDDHCGSCTACLEVCPTDAFPAPLQLDARRCISYLTIENKGPIPVEFRKNMGNRIFGCDDCLAACPWNKFAQTAHEQKLVSREALRTPSLEFLSQLDDKAFRKFFSANPVKRIGRDRFMRNVMIALGNSNNPTMCKFVMPHLDDLNPLVRGAAIWALSQLDADKAYDLAKHANGHEKDDSVLEEWARVQPS